ncbi:MAG: hypothetical protein QW279_01510 [Candidatus Jordarchaeaceae archaeon]
MKYKWALKKIDINKISEIIEKFFTCRAFRIKKEKDHEIVKIIAFQRKEQEARYVQVVIEKTLNDLTVNFEPGDKIDKLVHWSSFLQFFGGPLALRLYKSYEFYHKLEEEFWNYLEVEVEKL